MTTAVGHRTTEPQPAPRLKVRYFGEITNGSGNIMFPAKHPMRGGKFPRSHPCADNPMPTCALGAQRQIVPDAPPESPDGLGRFRALGYEASCFPEGDGICFQGHGKTGEQALADARAAFPDWDFKVERL